MKSVVVGTAGHIDHGKSALVQAFTGTDPDRLKEEKARGITIDLGFAHLLVGDVNLAFIDVPGHERFVKNMLAGVGGIDLVVLVVAADESVMPQTREHFEICRLLRVPAGLVAVTKTDLVDADTLELARLEIRELVAGSFLEGAPVIAVSSRTGQGMAELKGALLHAAERVAGRSADGAMRLPIDRVFSVKGFGTVVTGTLVSGRVRADDELRIVPGDRRVKARGVQVHGVRQAEARAGQRSAVNVSGVDVDEIERGQSLVAPGAFEATRLADASVEVLAEAKALKHGARVRMHQGTAEILGRVALIGPVGVNTTDQGVPVLPPASRGLVRLRLEHPTVLTRGDRFILRAYSPPTTIAGGYVVDPRPPRAALRTKAALERARQLDFDPSDIGGRADAELSAARTMIAEAGPAGLPVMALISRVGTDPRDVTTRIDALVAREQAIRVGEVLVAPAVMENLEKTIVDLVTAHHRLEPLAEGIPREEVRERLFGRAHVATFDRALSELEKQGVIVARDRLALTTHRVSLSPEDDHARAAIERAYRDSGLKPPDAASLQAETGVSGPTIDRILKILQRQKVLVKIETLIFHDEALRRLKQEMATLKKAEGPEARIDVATFKERFGVTRKFAIPLLEYLDRERVTRRVGDARIVL